MPCKNSEISVEINVILRGEAGQPEHNRRKGHQQCDGYPVGNKERRHTDKHVLHRQIIAHASHHKTVQAEDGMHGIEVLKEMSPAPDAIITDINMPRMDGFEFIVAVRKIEAYRAIPILVLTTESAPELKQRARDAGATGWIVKPFQPKKLIRALQMVTG